MRKKVKAIRLHIKENGFGGLTCATSDCENDATHFSSPHLECETCRAKRLEKKKITDKIRIDAKKAKKELILMEGVGNYTCSKCDNSGHDFDSNYNLLCESHYNEFLSKERFRALKKKRKIKKNISSHLCRVCKKEAKDIVKLQPLCEFHAQEKREQDRVEKAMDREKREKKALQIAQTFFPDISKANLCEPQFRQGVLDSLQLHGLFTSVEMPIWTRDLYIKRNPHRIDLMLMDIDLAVEWKNTTNTCSRKKLEKQMEDYRKGLDKLGLNKVDVVAVSIDGSLGMNPLEFFDLLEGRLKRYKKEENLKVSHGLTRYVREMKEKSRGLTHLFC